MPKINQDSNGSNGSEKRLAPKMQDTSDRTEKLAINPLDLSRMLESLRSVILRDSQGNMKVDFSPKSIVHIDKNKTDEVGVIFVCSLIVAAVTCDIIRTMDKKNGLPYPTRVYLCKKSAWQKLRHEDILTVMDDGMVKLNPRVFSIEQEVVRIQPDTSAEYVEL